MTFDPYLPDNAKDGPVTIASDICWRLNVGTDTPRHVTGLVVCAVAWAFTSFDIHPKVKAQILEELGLEWQTTPMGGTALTPKEIA